MKKPYKSKTLWINAIVAVLAIAFPPASAWIQSHPDMVMTGFAMLNMLLRVISKDKIGLEE
jgi:hypothetical protein